MRVLALTTIAALAHVSSAADCGPQNRDAVETNATLKAAEAFPALFLNYTTCQSSGFTLPEDDNIAPLFPRLCNAQDPCSSLLPFFAKIYAKANVQSAATLCTVSDDLWNALFKGQFDKLSQPLCSGGTDCSSDKIFDVLDVAAGADNAKVLKSCIATDAGVTDIPATFFRDTAPSDAIKAKMCASTNCKTIGPKIKSLITDAKLNEAATTLSCTIGENKKNFISFANLLDTLIAQCTPSAGTTTPTPKSSASTAGVSVLLVSAVLAAVGSFLM
jgi:hypothetical protein